MLDYIIVQLQLWNIKFSLDLWNNENNFSFNSKREPLKKATFYNKNNFQLVNEFEVYV